MTLGVWALVAAAAVAWGLRVFVRPLPVPPGTAVADMAPVLQADLTRLLGADPPPPAAAPEAAAPAPDARFTLIGVVAPRHVAAGRAARLGEGVALIAVDDRPPRAYRVGARVDGETVLQSVSARGAELGPRGGPVQVALQLAPPPPASTGTLPGVGGGAAPAPNAVVPPRVPAPAPVPPFARPGVQRPPLQGMPPQQPQPQIQPQPQNAPADTAPADGENLPQRKNHPTLM